jgi:hypothetical protein
VVNRLILIFGELHRLAARIAAELLQARPGQQHLLEPGAAALAVVTPCSDAPGDEVVGIVRTPARLGTLPALCLTVPSSRNRLRCVHS